VYQQIEVIQPFAALYLSSLDYSSDQMMKRKAAGSSNGSRGRKRVVVTKVEEDELEDSNDEVEGVGEVQNKIEVIVVDDDDDGGDAPVDMADNDEGEEEEEDQQKAEREKALKKFNSLKAAKRDGDVLDANDTVLALGLRGEIRLPCPAQLLVAGPILYKEIKSVKGLTPGDKRLAHQTVQALVSSHLMTRTLPQSLTSLPLHLF
jgi:hypothetical protein